MIKLNTILQDVKLYEGLIITRPIGTSIDTLERWSSATDKIDVSENENRNKIIIRFRSKLDDKEMDNLFSWINNLGWYISSYVTDRFPLKWSKFTDMGDLKKNNNSSILLTMTLEAKFDLEIGRGVYKTMYHVSPLKFKHKIDKIGLIPKTLSKLSYHPERIYLSIDKDDAKRLIPRFEKLSKDEHNDGWVIYKVNITRLTDYNNGLRFFKDPNLPEGIYTLSNIPPQFLSEDEIIKNDK